MTTRPPAPRNHHRHHYHDLPGRYNELADGLEDELADLFDSTEEQRFLNGVLRRTIERVHREADRLARRRLAALLAGIALLLAVSFVVGVNTGRHMPHRSVPHPHPAELASELSATDPRTGAHLAVAVTGKSGGAVLSVGVTGLPPGTACRLSVIGVDGSHADVASWRTPATAANASTVTLSVYLPPADIAAVDLTTPTGETLDATQPTHH